MSEATLTLPPESPAASTENAHRILIIDDEAGIRESLEVLLSLEGYTIDTAPDGEAGLNALGPALLRSQCSSISPCPA